MGRNAKKTSKVLTFPTVFSDCRLTSVAPQGKLGAWELGRSSSSSAHWVEHPNGVGEVAVLNPALDSDFSVVLSHVARQLVFNPSHGRITP